MRHLRALRIAHCLGERAAGADPATVSPLPPAKDDERNDDKGLQERNAEPEPHRMRRENVVNIQRPGEDETISSPVCALVA